MPFTAGLQSIAPQSVTYTGGGSATANANNLVTFTNVGSVVLNVCFSSTYDNYMMVLESSMTTTTNGSVLYRLRSGTGGSSDSSSNYSIQSTLLSSTSITTTRDSAQTSGILSRFSGPSTSYGACFATCYIFAPFLAQYTRTRSMVVDADSTLTIASRDYASAHAIASSYDGIEIFVASGSFSGNLALYGFAQ